MKQVWDATRAELLAKLLIVSMELTELGREVAWSGCKGGVTERNGETTEGSGEEIERNGEEMEWNEELGALVEMRIGRAGSALGEIRREVGVHVSMSGEEILWKQFESIKREWELKSRCVPLEGEEN